MLVWNSKYFLEEILGRLYLVLQSLSRCLCRFRTYIINSLSLRIASSSTLGQKFPRIGQQRWFFKQNSSSPSYNTTAHGHLRFPSHSWELQATGPPRTPQWPNSSRFHAPQWRGDRRRRRATLRATAEESPHLQKFDTSGARTHTLKCMNTINGGVVKNMAWPSKILTPFANFVCSNYSYSC